MTPCPPRRQRLDRAPGMPADPREVAAARWRAMEAILEARDIPENGWKVVGSLIIVKFMNAESGWAWPSVSTIADGVGMHERTVRRAIHGLASLGYLVVLQGGGSRRGSGDGRSNAYTIAWQRFSSTTRTPAPGIAEPFADTGSTLAVTPSEYRASVSSIPGPGVTEYRASVPDEPTRENPTQDLAHHARERATDDGRGSDVAVAAARRAITSLRRVQPAPNVELLRQQREAEATERDQRRSAARTLEEMATEKARARLRQVLAAQSATLAEVAEKAGVAEVDLRGMLDDGRVLPVLPRDRLKRTLAAIEVEAAMRIVS